MNDTPDKLIESDLPAKSGKRSPWWLRSSLWFAFGTITTTVVGTFLFNPPPPPPSGPAPLVAILVSAGFAALSALPFAAWARFRAKNVDNWKAYGFILPLACGISYLLFALAIFRRVTYSVEEIDGLVTFVICVALLLILAEFCVRLQPPERPWYQYSLRSLMIFMAVAGVLLACLGDLFVKSYRHQQLEAKWSKLGASSIRCSQGNLIWMSFYDISDAALKELENVTTLYYLYLHYNNTNLSDSNLDSLAHMEHLNLQIRGPKVSDLSPLTNLTNLKELFLTYTSVKDISPLKGLTNLKGLYLSETQIKDLSPLKGLTKLEFLDLGGTPVSKEEVQKLQIALPDCNIEWDGK